MAKHSFFCLDGHTCGNPVRVVTGGAPLLKGQTMIEKRADFMARFDWIRTGLCFEPRGHDMMSGTLLLPPTRPDCDIAFLYIETTGCLPMCGHATIGTVTMILENGLVTPRSDGDEGYLLIDTPAGVVRADYIWEGEHVKSVTLTNIPSFLYRENLPVSLEALGDITVDVAYGGNFYAIIDPQENYNDMADYSAGDLIAMSRELRTKMNALYDITHPEQLNIKGLSHILWTGKPTDQGLAQGANARNAVFYGEKALDRSPCGTGTSARLAQWHAKGRIKKGESFVHESIIGSLFEARVTGETKVDGKMAIIPSIKGWAIQTGINTIFIDDRDPFAHGFTVT